VRPGLNVNFRSSVLRWWDVDIASTFPITSSVEDAPKGGTRKAPTISVWRFFLCCHGGDFLI